VDDEDSTLASVEWIMGDKRECGVAVRGVLDLEVGQRDVTSSVVT
jgi:hypothetical protein